MNLLLHGMESPQIDPGNSLRFPLREIGDKDRVDIILTNPPFGGEEEKGILGNFPEDKQTSETALLFLQLIMRKLRRNPNPGRAAMVVPNGTLFGDGICARIKEELLKEFNLPGSDLLSFADIALPRIRATSTAQHLAEKVHALTRPYNNRINTRVKDLGDIMLLMDRGLPQLETVKNAVEEIFTSRQTHKVPGRIDTPPTTWASSYSAIASELNLTQTTMERATSRLNDYWKTLF